MGVPLSHWSRPRDTIACRHKDDDFAYCLHGAHSAALALQYFDYKPSELRQKTLIDYGCGTGRISRVFAAYFASVVAYDPNPECIDEAHLECPQIAIPNLTLTNTLPYGGFDCLVSINVLEHLDGKEAEKFMADIMELADERVIWYRIGQDFMHKYMTPEQIAAEAEMKKRKNRINVVKI